jgi:molecular chaperone GrpE
MSSAQNAGQTPGETMQSENNKLFNAVFREISRNLSFTPFFQKFFQRIYASMNQEEFEPKDNIENVEAENIEPSEKDKSQAENNNATKSEETSKKSSEEQLKAEVADLKDKYLRLYSEFDNFRKRSAKEKVDLIQTANKDLFLAVIPVVDDFERAKKAFSTQAEKDAQALENGFDLIYAKLVRLLEQKGLKVMPSTVGTDFDMDFHEAITQIPAPSEDMKGKVIDEIERGYMIGEKVVRFAKVVVGV